MIVIADSGSTKTIWAKVETGERFVTQGLNPLFASDSVFTSTCTNVRHKFHIKSPNLSVYFYGAGCSGRDRLKRVKEVISSVFQTDKVVIESDLLGACRAVSAGKASMVGILGTGSNACLFSGSKIGAHPTSTGYILGDKGSANHVGRILLNGYLVGSMPEELRRMFHEDYPMEDCKFMDAVYRKPYPNRFLASLAPFATKHLDDDYCRSVVERSLNEWFDECLLPLWRKKTVNNMKVHIVGGYAKSIEPLLRSVLSNRGLFVTTVVADPMDGLLDYYRDSKNS